MSRPTLATAAFVAILAVIPTACSSETDLSGSPVTDATVTDSAVTSSAAPTTSLAGTPATSAPTPVTTVAPAPAPTAAPSTPTTPAPATGPRITSFSFTLTSPCPPPPNPEATFQPDPGPAPAVRAEWRATGAESVYLAIGNPDGPFVQNLTLVGSYELPYSCGNPQTYYVVAVTGTQRDVESKTL